MANTVAELKNAGFTFMPSEGHSDAECCTLVTHQEPFWYYNELQAKLYASPEKMMSYLKEHLTAATESGQGGYSLLIAGQQYLSDRAEFPFRLITAAQKKVLDEATSRHTLASNEAKRAQDDFNDALYEFKNYLN